MLTSLFDVPGDPEKSSHADGNVAIALAFALMNKEDLAIDVDVVDVQRTDFGASNTGGVQNFEDGSIANAERRGDVGLLQDSFDFIG